jgi:hypothetical protein
MATKTGWIQKMKLKKGAFTAQAKKAGAKSTASYAKQVTKPGSKASATTKRRANLAKTFAKMNRKGK